MGHKVVIINTTEACSGLWVMSGWRVDAMENKCIMTVSVMRIEERNKMCLSLLSEKIYTDTYLNL